MASATKGTGSLLPPRQTGVTVSRPGVTVTAFGRNPDGPGTLLRVWEPAGVSGELDVTLPNGTKYFSAQAVNLRGEESGAPRAITNGTLCFQLGRFAPVSFLLE